METTEKIKQDIIEHLKWDNSINANDVSVHVSDGNVQLQGKVPNFSSKIAATQDAYMVSGVKYVDNQIEVGVTEREKLPDDTEITHNLINMFLWNSHLRSSDIQVKSENRIVTLTGSVETFREKYLAEDIASNAWGVRDVINLLEVKLIRTFIDADIQTDIENAFTRAAFIDEKGIDVNVRNGVVTLSGTVVNYPVKKQALDIAAYTAGVTEVIDNLSIM
jgi:osmotically-inducible protein OsmY